MTRCAAARTMIFGCTDTEWHSGSAPCCRQHWSGCLAARSGGCGKAAKRMAMKQGAKVFRDGRTVPGGTSVESDVCIIGGGVVGLVLGRELSGLGRRVCIVESGGLEFDASIQELARGEVVGEPTNDPVTTRQRQLGGAANLWDSHLEPELLGFRCAPMDAIDFEQREAVPDSGWPFDRAHLDPYYQRAQAICGLGPYTYTAASWASDDAPVFPVDRTLLDTTVWQFGRQDRFLSRYPA